MKGHLTVARDVQAAVLSFDQVLVVREFSDVFIEELPGMAPNREIELYIDLAIGAQVISITPYHMAPAELCELKVQLQDILNKGFTCPSISLWGAPMLFMKKKDRSMRLCIDYR